MAELKDVRGVGPKGLTLLHKLGINTIDDLVTHYPFRYEILERTDLTKANDGDKVIIDGKIESVPILVRFKAGLNKMSFRLVTPSGVVGVSIFNRAFLKKQLLVGTTVTVIGKFDKTKNVVTANDIKLVGLSDKARIEPVYHATSGLTSKTLSSYINMALLEYGNTIEDFIPEYIRERYNFFLKKKENSGLERVIDYDKVNKFIGTIPFELTNDQKKATDEILKDLESNSRMNRLLQGDVGSGKTIVSFIALLANAYSGYQGALMAPTEILAIQHYNNIKEFFKKEKKIKIEVLTGSTSKKEKTRIYSGLEDGSIDIVVGTHALIQDDVTYNNLGLVVTDEQHRFGVHQRANLQNKGIMPDVLYMSATPIPRTYALTIYGDMDVSTIKEQPKGRKKVDTIVKDDSEIKDVLNMMLDELKKHHQVYVIAPLIDDSNSQTDLNSVIKLKDEMQQAFGKYFKIDIIHGKMATASKDMIMNKFKKNEIQILISTTVVEVGVDVQNATCMVIFDADRFGLSTLHQLRGRVGRGEDKSLCILVSSSDTERLKIMEKVSDGFLISEEDFKLRGHGDLFGTKQSGDMIFKIANVRIDYKILLQAKKDSEEYLLNKEYDKDGLKEKIISSIDKA